MQYDPKASLDTMYNNIVNKQKIHDIKQNASNLMMFWLLELMVLFKKEFSRICKENQSSASSELKRYMLKIVEQGSL